MKKLLTSITALTMAAISLFSTASAVSAKEIKTQSGNHKFKIVMKNKTENKTFKAKGEFAPEKYDTVKADFTNLPVGEYKVAVYEYSTSNHSKELLAKSNWTAESFKDAKYDVTTYFYVITKEIEVHTNWITSKHLDLAKINSKYQVVAKNKNTHEFFEKNLSLNFNRYDAFLTKLDGLSRGNYDISVYKLNSKGHKTERIAHSAWKCKVAKGLLGEVDIDYFPVVSEVKATLELAHKDIHDYTIAMQNIKTGKTYEAKTGVDWNKYDTDYAIIKHVPAGKYNITVYNCNAKNGNTSMCANTTYKLHATGKVNVKVSYYTVPSEIEAKIYKISK